MILPDLDAVLNEDPQAEHGEKGDQEQQQDPQNKAGLLQGIRQPNDATPHNGVSNIHGHIKH